MRISNSTWDLRRAIFALTALAVLGCSTTAYGWGSGHLTQARMLKDALPKEIVDYIPADLWPKILREYCEYPDNYSKLTEDLIGKDAVEYLKRNTLGSIGPQGAHDSTICFVLLSRAFRDNNPSRAAVWMGCLVHAIGDHYSHTALNAYLWEVRHYKIKCAGGLGDLSQLEATQAGLDKLKKAMEGYTPKSMSDDPAVTLKKMMTMIYTGQDFAAQRQCRMAAAYNVNEKPEVLDDAMAAMAELGAVGVQMTADAVVSAWEYAKQKKPVELNDKLIAQAEKACQEFFESKPLAHDTVYEGTLDSHPAGPVVGVLVEPSKTPGYAEFGYCGCVFQASIMRTLRAANIPYVALDIRKVVKDGLPAVDKMPVLVISSGSYDFSEPAFKKYADSGGRFLWFGGRDKGLLGKLSATLKPANRNVLPVSMTYCDPNQKIVDKVAIAFAGAMAKPLGAEPLKFVNNPNIAGWTTPRCELQVLSEDPDIQMLATVSDGKETMSIGAALVEGGKARHIFLPVYLLVPFTLSKEQTMDFSKPTLDGVGTKIVLTSIGMLAPDLVAGAAKEQK